MKEHGLQFIYALLNMLCEMSPYILLGFLFAGVLKAFVRPEFMSRHLAGKGWKPVLKGALLGIPLPLCSCGVLPTAISLRRRGASKGATTSFLIATPQTGVDSIAATYALLGPAFAVIRPVAALIGSMIGGMSVERFDGNDTNCSTELTTDPCSGACCSEQARQGGLIHKIVEAVRYGFVDMVASVGKWLVIGLVIAAVITVAVPDEMFLSLSSHPLAAMLVMMAVAVPMYICATGSIPVAMSLMLKGLTPGVAFVLLMAGPAANFASVLLLRKAMGVKATAIYVGSVAVTAVLIGLLIDYLLPAQWFVLPGAMAGGVVHCHFTPSLLPALCSFVLIGLLINAFIRNKSKNISNMSDTRIYKVKGMACPHCKATVEKAVGGLPGVEKAVANLADGTVAVDGDIDASEVVRAVELAGFSVDFPEVDASK